MAGGQLDLPSADEAERKEVDEVAKAAAMFGLVISDADRHRLESRLEQAYFLWPENVERFNFWLSIQTQWNNLGGGRILGLRYEGIQAAMELDGIPRKNRPELFALVKQMEQATLNEWSKLKR